MATQSGRNPPTCVEGAFWQLFFSTEPSGTGWVDIENRKCHKKWPSYIKLLISTDRRLSELPNRISTQDLSHRSSGDIHGQPSRNLAGNSAKLST